MRVKKKKISASLLISTASLWPHIYTQTHAHFDLTHTPKHTHTLTSHIHPNTRTLWPHTYTQTHAHFDLIHTPKHTHTCSRKRDSRKIYSLEEKAKALCSSYFNIKLLCCIISYVLMNHIDFIFGQHSVCGSVRNSVTMWCAIQLGIRKWVYQFNIFNKVTTVGANDVK